MTEPSQYFKGRTVQEQMNEVIGYVDTRAAEVATTAIASDVAQVHQDMLDADADAQAAAASAAAAAGTLANAVKKTGEASQSIAGDIAVAGDLSAGGDLAVTGDAGVQGNLSVLGDCDFNDEVKVRTPVNNTDAANKKYVDDALDAYAPMVRTTGNQTKAGVLTLTNQPIVALGGSMGRLLTTTNYLHFATIQSSTDTNFIVPVIIFERSGLVIGDIGITVSGGTVTAVTFTGKTIVGTTNKIFVGVAMSDDGMKLYCHSDSVNRYFIANILGAMSGSGYAQRVAPALEIVSSTPAGYVEAAFIEA